MRAHLTQLAGFGLVAALAASAPLPSSATETAPPAAPVVRPSAASTLELKYNLSISILGLGHVDVSSRIDGAQYSAQSMLDTKGIINIFWAAHIEAQANGRIHARGLHPAMYDSRSQRSSGRQQMTVTYGPNGPINVVAVPERPRQAQKYPVTEEQRRNTVDPLSAMVFVASGITASADNPCGTTAPVFDGRRRYDIELSFLRNVSVKLEGGAYDGPAIVCQIKYIQIAGYKQKIIAEGKRLPPMYAYLVPMPGRSDPSRRYLVPVRLWAETSWGTAEAIVSRVQIDGQVVAMAK